MEQLKKKDNLEADLLRLEKQIISFFKGLNVENTSFPEGIVGPKFNYSNNLSKRKEKIRSKLIFDLKKLELEFFNLYSKFPDTLEREIQDCFALLLGRLALRPDWILQKDNRKNLDIIRDDFKFLYNLVDSLGSNFEMNHYLLIVPDVDTLINIEDFHVFERLVGKNLAIVAIMKSVMDDIHDVSQMYLDEETTAKAQRVLERLNDANLNESYNNLTFSFVEDFKLKAMPARWLDFHNDEDVLLADILELSKSYSSAFVVLMSSNIDIQNKAELLKIPFLDASSRESLHLGLDIVKDIDFTDSP
ncbi:MAG: hypothetical protein JXR63_06060 [Spirochaetales bacterium]|nr:hypothetical protein [Spirochaetales bacterium]